MQDYSIEFHSIMGLTSASLQKLNGPEGWTLSGCVHTERILSKSDWAGFVTGGIYFLTNSQNIRQ